MKTRLIAVALSATLAGCSGSSGTSSGGGGVESVGGINNVPTTSRAYTTSSGVQVTESVSVRALSGACDQLGNSVMAEVNYDIRASAGGVEIDVRYDYPAWHPTAPKAANVPIWNQYIDRLIVHENGHRDIGIERAEKMQRDPPRAQQIFDNTRGLDADYDSRTNHGATQGAVLNCQ